MVYYNKNILPIPIYVYYVCVYICTLYVYVHCMYIAPFNGFPAPLRIHTRLSFSNIPFVYFRSRTA